MHAHAELSASTDDLYTVVVDAGDQEPLPGTRTELPSHAHHADEVA
jgi:hypothetical protein